MQTKKNEWHAQLFQVTYSIIVSLKSFHMSILLSCGSYLANCILKWEQGLRNGLVTDMTVLEPLFQSINSVDLD